MIPSGYALLNPSLQKGNIGDELIYYAINKFLSINGNISINLSIDNFVNPDTVDIINKSKAFIICGTCLYERRFKSGWGANIGLKYLKAIKAPILIIGVGCNIPFLKQRFYLRPHNILGKKGYEVIKYLHDIAFTVSIRDDYTADLLKKNGVSRYSMTGCPSLYVNPEYDKLKRQPPEDYVCFSFRDLSSQIVPAREVYRFARFTELFYKHFSKKCRVLICCHGKRDPDYLPSSIPVRDIIVLKTPEELIEIYSRALLVTGIRVHACMSSISFNVPTALIVYDTRGLSIAEMFNIPYVRIGTRNYEENMLEKCNHILKYGIDLKFMIDKKKIYYERFKKHVLMPFNKLKYA